MNNVTDTNVHADDSHRPSRYRKENETPMAARKPAKPIRPDPWDFETLLIIDKRIDASEAESMHDRWEFGQSMLEARGGKKRLPNGYLAALVERTGKSQTELSNRLRFAEMYPTEAELSNALESFTSWHELVENLYEAKPKENGETDEEFLARLRAEDAAHEDGTKVVRISATVDEAVAHMNKLYCEIQRLARIRFEQAFAAVSRQPVSATRDAKTFGLLLRWQRQQVIWGLDKGQSIEEVADAMGTSAQMCQDYLDLDAPTSTDDEFFASITEWCGEKV